MVRSPHHSNIPILCGRCFKILFQDFVKHALNKAQDYEAATKSHEEELKTLALVKEVIVSEKSEAEGIAYGLRQTSLLQFK